MKVLFAVHDEKVSLSIVKKYQREYKEIISYKNVYYFNAILKEIQRDKSYDRVIIDEDLEEFTSTSYEEKDKFVFNKLDSITDEASNTNGKDIPIILICTERRTKSEDILVKLFGIGIYNAIIGNDRSTDEVCRLIKSPRSKKEAKAYYKIDAKNVDYDPKDENDVSEEEMQHILSYFKRLGKNSDKYVECFRKIASQYNENQMKIIVAILTKNVKDILQDNSTEFQKYIPKNSTRKAKTTKSKNKVVEETEPTSERLLDSKIGNNKRQIVIPSAIEKNLIKKINIKNPVSKKEENDEDDYAEEDFEETIQPKRRGRPSNNTDDNDETINKRKKKESKKDEIDEIEDKFNDILPGIDNHEEIIEKYEPISESLLRPEPISDDVLPGIEENDYDEDDDDNEELYELNKENDDDNEESYELKKENDDDNEESYELNQENNEKVDNPPTADEEEFEPYDYNKNDYERSFEQENYNLGLANSRIPKQEIQTYEQSYNDYDYTNYNNLLSSDRKVIAFVGTSKNGTSFIVNNIAKILSENGINTAILDATQNKNSYYIYNDNDDNLRNDAANSLEDLIQGIPGGMKVAKNLSVYVEMPGQNNTKINEVGPILENLVKNYSCTLIDCDFSTPLDYFANSQEIFLVQSMDVLTIQPLTAFLKELKNRDILEQQRIRIIINKAMRLRRVTPKQIVGGMSRYNNPEMSMMTELFDRNAIYPIEIPFDMDVYAKYLEGIADCNVSTSKYPKDFQNLLNKLSNVIYPLLPGKKSKEKPESGYQYSNGYSSGFSNNVNNTLNNMRKKY